MIREQDLIEAIAECQGERDPNANTCIKLAAYYTILNNITDKPSVKLDTVNPTINSQPQISYESDTEFGKLIRGKDTNDVMAVMDELMSALSVLNKSLYNSVLRKL